MTLADIARIRLHNQQLTKPRFSTPAELVRWFGAIQSQDLLASLWAVGLRLKISLTEAQVEQAIADKTIARGWPMRGTIHLVPAEDLRWMTRLLGPRLDAKVASNFRRAELTPDIIKRAGDIIGATLAGKQCTRAEIYAALEAAGIPTNGLNGEQRGMHLLVYWARHGLLCITPRRGKQQTFALLDEWLPGGRDLSDDEALAELATRYFQSHGPATTKDFAWWTGLTVTEAKRATEHIRKNLHTINVEGIEYLMTDKTAVTSSAPLLLPAYDEYTIAYADRTAAVDPDLLRTVGYGIAPNLIIDGRITGTWKRTLQKQSVVINVELRQPLSPQQKQLVKNAAERYAHYIGLALEFKV